MQWWRCMSTSLGSMRTLILCLDEDLWPTSHVYSDCPCPPRAGLQHWATSTDFLCRFLTLISLGWAQFSLGVQYFFFTTYVSNVILHIFRGMIVWPFTICHKKNSVCGQFLGQEHSEKDIFFRYFKNLFESFPNCLMSNAVCRYKNKEGEGSFRTTNSY